MSISSRPFVSGYNGIKKSETFEKKSLFFSNEGFFLQNLEIFCPCKLSVSDDHFQCIGFVDGVKVWWMGLTAGVEFVHLTPKSERQPTQCYKKTHLKHMLY